MELCYHLLDVFTDVPFGGNPLAVFVDSPALDAELMQRIARELSLSETVFVRPARDPAATRSLRIFTPGVELPFAGHPTVGTASLLVDLGLVAGDDQAERRFMLEEAVGLVPVTVRRDGDGPFFAELTAAQVPESRDEVPSRRDLAALLGLSASDLVEGSDSPQAVSAGVPFLFVPVRDREALARVSLDLARWRELLLSAWAQHVYVFCRNPTGADADIRARMFAPAMGITEDPATGGAAAAFAGYLAWRVSARDATLRWTVEQGIEMKRPSRLVLTAVISDGEVRQVRVGGSSVRVGKGVLRI